MPINIHKSLPAKDVLEAEKIFVMTEDVAVKQDIRPLKILILNLMPNKIETETHLLRVLSNTPLQVDISLMGIDSHTSKNTKASHLQKFYRTLRELKNEKFDGMIVTGAPLETMDFNKVDYIHELQQILEWSKTNVNSSFFICWGAMVALKYFFDIDKHLLDQKISGVFKHQVLEPLNPLMRGFDDVYMMPHSRHSEIKKEDVLKHSQLEILSFSETAGVAVIANKNGRQFFVTGHAEYDRTTLANEYFRDINKHLNPKIPQNYFPDDNPAKKPVFSWKAHANLMYTNWLNYFVYQKTPYDINKIG
ncbi:MAG: homoserine O-succinyltransferase [Clostridia bacterium]|nr:homoserine O-succinyltransferase [Clostridia bacterium]